MADPARFVVVEYDGAGLPFVDWAKAHPGVTLDMILSPLRAAGADLQIPGFALVRGLSAKAMTDLPRLLEASYAPTQAMRRDAKRGEWFGRITLHVANMRQAPAAQAVARLSDRFGPPWSHVDDGVVYMRLRVPDGADADALARDIQAEAAARGAEAQVSVESFGRHDFGVWEELVQAAIGLRS